jgi:hypothetical protein
MSTLTVKFEIVEEGVGFGMSELKEYVLPESSCVSPWAGRWNEYFEQKKKAAEQVRSLTEEPQEE